MCDIEKEMRHVDALVICYRPRAPWGLDAGEIELAVKDTYDPTLGHLDAFIKSIEMYRGGGLKITFKLPMSRGGQEVVIAVIEKYLNSSTTSV